MEPEEVPSLPKTSGAKAGAYGVGLLNGSDGTDMGERPTATLGLYTSMYLAQGAFLPVKTAALGVTAQQKILLGQGTAETSETFSLLKEFGAILQVDIVDSLNRSGKREETLDTYLRSLANIMQLADRKIKELEQLEETTADLRKDKRDVVRKIEREIRDALNEENYEFAGTKQEEMATANGELAILETKEEQTKDILVPYNSLMDVANDRYDAITANRRVLLAGLKVVEVPGIEDLDILENDTFLQRTKRNNRVQKDVLGTSHIDTNLIDSRN